MEFDGFGAEKYAEVNEALGFDVGSSEGWPDGMLFHAAGGAGGDWIVFESGITGPPRRVEWLDLATYLGSE